MKIYCFIVLALNIFSLGICAADKETQVRTQEVRIRSVFYTSLLYLPIIGRVLEWW